MLESNNILFQKLDAFIRKYYKNVLLKGVLLSATLLLLLFLTFIFAEYWLYFSTKTRLFLLITFLLTTLSTLVFWIFIPLFKIVKLGKIMSYEQASDIVGRHFPEIQDKLLNTLQLTHTQGYSSSLVDAAIQKKTQELRPINFKQAVDFTKNMRYARYLLIPLLALILTSFVAPYIISKATRRILQYNQSFPVELPYSFVVQNHSLTCYEGENYQLVFKIIGEKRPAEVFVVYQSLEYKVEVDREGFASFDFLSLRKNQPFRLTDGKNTVLEETIRVIAKTRITNLNIQLKFPAYLNKEKEEQKTGADLLIPEGTEVSWTYQTQNTSEISLLFLSDEKKLTSLIQNDKPASFQYKPTQSGMYAVLLKNAKTGKRDTLLQNLQLIPDESPQIAAEPYQDSLRSNITYYSGTVKDDYGFTKLVCHVVERNTQEDVISEQQQNIPITPKILSQPFYHIIDANDFSKTPGNKVEYYFEVWDNDGVHGPKSAKTKSWTLKIPNKDEIQEEKDALASSIKDDLTESIQEAKKLQKELEQLWKDLANKRNISWEEKNKINSLLQRQKDLQEELQKKAEKNKQLQEMNPSEQSEKLLEKQQKIQEMMEELLSDDMKKMLEEIQKLMEEANKDQQLEKLEDIKLTNEDIQKELDRSLELFKQLEFEQKLEQNIQELARLSEEQKKANQKLEEAKTEKELKDAQNQQDQIKKDFDKLQEEIQKMQEMNDQLEFKTELPDTKAQEQEIEQEMTKAQQDIQKKDKKGASKSQKGAAKKMDDLKQQMQEAQESAEQEAQEENLEDMRQLMENLVKLSFSQEELMKEMKKTQTTDPKYTVQIQTQKKLKDDTKMIEDSLFALSKRVPEIESIVNEELNEVHENMSKTLDFLNNRRNFEANAKQQLIMTSVNNLALLFDEMIQQAQKNMSQKEGQASCNKPGSGKKPKPGDMRKAQQQIAQQLQKLKQELQKQKDGPGSPGGKSMSKELAKMAAEQEALRRQLQGMMEEMKANGEKPGGDLKKIGDLMEETERDIVNKRITDKTLERQQEILTRLLESDKADRERDQDQKRESTESKSQEKRNLLEEFKYKAKKTNNIDLLETIPPSMVDFYKQKVNGYFNKQ